MKFDTLDTSNFTSLKKIREQAKKSEEKKILYPDIKDVLKAAYAIYYAKIACSGHRGLKKNEMV